MKGEGNSLRKVYSVGEGGGSQKLRTKETADHIMM